MEKYTVESILKNTDEDELFCLFGEFLNRILGKMKWTGVFSVDDEHPVFLDSDKMQVIKDMISK